MVATGSTADRQRWEERYTGSEHVWSGCPNPALEAEAAHLPSGYALDLGCGEGADAVWLAEHGWQVTAVDFAAPALARGRRAARERGVAERIEWRQADLARWHPPRSAFDLVNVQYVHLRDDDAEVTLLRRGAAAVAPGGRLLVVGHDAFPAGSTHAPSDVVFRTPRQTWDILALPGDEWGVEVAEERTRPADPAHGHEQRPDRVLLARRTPG